MRIIGCLRIRKLDRSRTALETDLDPGCLDPGCHRLVLRTPWATHWFRFAVYCLQKCLTLKRGEEENNEKVRAVAKNMLNLCPSKYRRSSNRKSYG